jgi:hypothetical protein
LPSIPVREDDSISFVQHSSKRAISSAVSELYDVSLRVKDVLDVLLNHKVGSPDNWSEFSSSCSSDQFNVSSSLESSPELEELPFSSVTSLSSQEIGDFLAGVPAVEVNIVSSHVESIGIKYPQKISVKLSKHKVSLFINRVQLTAWRLATELVPWLSIDADSHRTPTGHGYWSRLDGVGAWLHSIASFKTLPSPTDVRRSIQLRNNTYSTNSRVFNKVFDILWEVDFVWGVSSIEGELGNSLGVEWEGMGISDVPVKRVQFVVCHSINEFLHRFNRDEVP